MCVCVCVFVRACVCVSAGVRAYMSTNVYEREMSDFV